MAKLFFRRYNYLVEPLIRNSLNINLKGQILILDEAHNIEDSARSAASWQVTQEALQDAMKDLEKLAQVDLEAESHNQLAGMCSHLSKWIDSCVDDLRDYNDFGSSSKVWTGTEVFVIISE
jgi:Fanconi anemia group J protein